MDRITSALRQKYGPLPGYVWAGGVVLLGLFVVPHLRGLFGSASAPAGTSGPGPAVSDGSATPMSSSGPGDSTQPPPAPAPTPTPSAPPPAPQPAYRTYVVQHGDTLWGIAARFLGNGARWPEIYKISHLRSGDPNLIYPGETVNIPMGGGSGMGGPKSVGSRSAVTMWHGHPLLKSPMRSTQLLRAVGGPAAHTQNVHRVAAQAGVHPARVLALNPFHTGTIRLH